jgi:hypothetical protein
MKQIRPIHYQLCVILMFACNQAGMAQSCAPCLASPYSGNDPSFLENCNDFNAHYSSHLKPCDSITPNAYGFMYLKGSITWNNQTFTDLTPGGGSLFMYGRIDTQALTTLYSTTVLVANGEIYCIDPMVKLLTSHDSVKLQIRVANNTIDTLIYDNTFYTSLQIDSIFGGFIASSTDSVTITLSIQKSGNNALYFILDEFNIRKGLPYTPVISISSSQSLEMDSANTLLADSGFDFYYWFRNGIVFDTTTTHSLAVTPDSMVWYYHVTGENANGCYTLSDILKVDRPTTPATCDCFVGPNLITDGSFSQWPNSPANCPNFNWLTNGIQNFPGGIMIPHSSEYEFFSLQNNGNNPCTLPAAGDDAFMYCNLK